LDFGSSEKVVDANHVFPILVIPDQVVKDFPEDEGEMVCEEVGYVSKELATCDDSLGLSGICMEGSTHAEARRNVSRTSFAVLPLKDMDSC